MPSYAHAFLDPLKTTLLRIASFLPRLLVALVLFLLFWRLATLARNLLGAFEGSVKDVQIHTTTLRTYNNEIVAIPNSNVYTNPVINHTRLRKRRYCVLFNTSLRADVQTVQQEALRAAANNPQVLTDLASYVRLRSVKSGDGALLVFLRHISYFSSNNANYETS